MKKFLLFALMAAAALTMLAAGCSREPEDGGDEPTHKLIHEDRDVVQLQKATVGGGVNLVVMGDGYVAGDMLAGGKYERDMRRAAENFFTIYPLDVYRKYFNVWMVVAISPQSGMSTASRDVDTKFGVKQPYSPNVSTLLEMVTPSKKQLAVEYAGLAAAKAGKTVNDMTVIMPINYGVRAGTCLMDPALPAFAMCPTGPDEQTFRQIVIHEAGGHGFARLCDEYMVVNAPVPAEWKEQIIREKADYGYYANVDVTNNAYQTTWGAFVDLDKYSDRVWTYEGGAGYKSGIWRPEELSVMEDDSKLYFNAPSRWEIVRRVYEQAGVAYTFEQFVAADVVPAKPIRTRADYSADRMPLDYYAGE